MAQSENNKLAYSIMLLAGAVVVVGAVWLYAQFYIQGQINTREKQRCLLENRYPENCSKIYTD